MLAACAHEPVARSPITLNSGIPLSDGLKSYDVKHYTLRNDILTSKKAITGSSDITFRAVHPMSVLELDFDGLYAIDGISDSDGQFDYTRDAATIYITLRNELTVGDTWWPCKDRPAGEPEGMDLYFTVADGLTAVSNAYSRANRRRHQTRRVF